MKKNLIIGLLAALFCIAAIPTRAQSPEKNENMTIISDVLLADGLRQVVVSPADIVCSVKIDILLRGTVVEEVKYTRGCNGNAKGIGALVKGMEMDEAIERLEGITCGKKATSCPDQLAQALKVLRTSKPQKAE